MATGALACPPAVCGAAHVALPRRAQPSRQACGPARASAVGRLRARRSVSCPAAAAESDSKTQAYLPEFYDPNTSTRWHFIIANADFMLNDENNEHFPEVLRERRRFFLENNAPVNFFLVTNPAWLASLPEVAKQVRQPAVALVCPDATWITYVKLRMDRVLKGELQGSLGDVTASGGAVPPFARPASWTAPYNKYSQGWWDMFTYKP